MTLEKIKFADWSWSWSFKIEVEFWSLQIEIEVAAFLVVCFLITILVEALASIDVVNNGFNHWLNSESHGVYWYHEALYEK